MSGVLKKFRISFQNCENLKGSKIALLGKMASLFFIRMFLRVSPLVLWFQNPTKKVPFYQNYCRRIPLHKTCWQFPLMNPDYVKFFWWINHLQLALLEDDFLVKRCTSRMSSIWAKYWGRRLETLSDYSRRSSTRRWSSCYKMYK
jgi:hypothetical protein